MKKRNRLNVSARTLVIAGLATGMVCGLTTVLCSAEPKSDAANPTPDKPTESKAVKKLTGAELYAIHCNRCHPERYPTEVNSGQWKNLLTHMRVRANLPAKQAKEILKYLQEESGT